MARVNSFLPSKKFAVIACSVFVILISGFFIVKELSSINRVSPDNKNGIQVSPTVITAPVAALIDRDTDNDGVKDWEELLWNTNPASADTNGDGISDKTEIEKKKADLALSNEDSVAVDSQTLSQTDALARSLFATIVSLNQSGSYSAENVAAISKSLSDTIGEQKKLDDVYSIMSLKTSAASKTSVIAYRTTVNQILKKSTYQTIGTELPILSQIANGSDPTDTIYPEIGQIGSKYKSLARELSTVSVPSDAVTYHLNLMNTYDHMGTALTNIQSSKEDPIIGLVGISQYNQYNQTLNQLADSFRSYFISYGIIGS